MVALLAFACAKAQDDHVVTDPNYRIKKQARCPKLLVDLSTGINNNGGLLGAGLDYHFISDVSVHGGIGLLSTWGTKFYGGIKCHLRPCHTGWAFGGGYSYSTGIPEYSARFQTVNGTDEVVTLRYLPQSNVFAAGYRSWYVGHNRNRITLQLGYSISMTSRKYEQLSGTQLSKLGSSVAKFGSPGGFIAAFIFSLGT
ncbi:hypothetical protein GCM10023093_13650 [Nemorincola caseinilytica]|uniref:Uncharacterized protein n=1 Tax=Nemorincola caseinilytica TaxID=2054315 RepID=A0ABP8NDJ1_9BACT